VSKLSVKCASNKKKHVLKKVKPQFLLNQCSSICNKTKRKSHSHINLVFIRGVSSWENAAERFHEMKKDRLS
jgi:hypothetical protein